MNAIVPKGWCPSLFEPMAAADGWLVRVKPPSATLTARAARLLAAAVAQFGNGQIELTSRANLQVRGLATGGIAPFAAAVVAAGLADPDPAIERRRAVIHPPLPTARPGTAAEIEAMLMGDPALAALPAKFTVAVDVAATADLTVLSGETGYLVAPEGGPLAVETADPVDAVRRLARAFLQLAPPARRMRALDAGRVFAAAGLNAATPMVWPSPPAIIGRSGLGVPFGAMTAATLMLLAERLGDATLRVTPWRSFVLQGMSVRDLPDLGLIVDPADPRLNIVTCTGRPGCASASADVRADAALLLNLRLPGPVHVSGCAKGCAHPGRAPITLVGQDGGYGLIRDGRPSDSPKKFFPTIQSVAQGLGAKA